MCLSNIKDTYLKFLCSNQKFEEVFMNNLKAFVYVLTITAISLNLKIYDTKKKRPLVATKINSAEYMPKLDPLGSTVRYQVMKLCSGSV